MTVTDAIDWLCADKVDNRAIVWERSFDAPRELVFDIWTNPEEVVMWWGPKGHTTTVHEMNVKPGCEWRFVMQDPEGKTSRHKVVYQEVLKPVCLIYLQGEDEAGASDYYQVRVRFVEESNKTRLTMKMVFPTAEKRDRRLASGAVEVGHEGLDRLRDHLAACKN